MKKGPGPENTADLGSSLGDKTEQEDKYLLTVCLNIVLMTKVHFGKEMYDSFFIR